MRTLAARKIISALSRDGFYLPCDPFGFSFRKNKKQGTDALHLPLHLRIFIHFSFASRHGLFSAKFKVLQPQ
jgi:hypothetical protein